MFFCNSLGNEIGNWNEPRDHCWDAQGMLIVCDSGNNRVLRNFTDYKERENWEIILSEENIPGSKPSCVTVVDDKYLYLVSSVDDAPKLSCYLYCNNNPVIQNPGH